MTASNRSKASPSPFAAGPVALVLAAAFLLVAGLAQPALGEDNLGSALRDHRLDRAQDHQEFRQGRREDWRTFKAERRDERRSAKDGEPSGQEFRQNRRQDLRELKAERRDERREFRKERRLDRGDLRRKLRD